MYDVDLEVIWLRP